MRACRASWSLAVSFNSATICGSSLSTTSSEPTASLMSAASLSMLSSMSNSDLKDWQTGMSKQCGSQ
ncbi:Uncharacterised protein [Mycobacteroides abscessus subsp. abscessus]|nr:Uncharacterised protein [Mycobacteroides abscessus subsp. abscessus]